MDLYKRLPRDQRRLRKRRSAAWRVVAATASLKRRRAKMECTRRERVRRISVTREVCAFKTFWREIGYPSRQIVDLEHEGLIQNVQASKNQLRNGHVAAIGDPAQRGEHVHKGGGVDERARVTFEQLVVPFALEEPVHLVHVRLPIDLRVWGLKSSPQVRASTGHISDDSKRQHSVGNQEQKFETQLHLLPIKDSCLRNLSTD